MLARHSGAREDARVLIFYLGKRFVSEADAGSGSVRVFHDLPG